MTRRKEERESDLSSLAAEFRQNRKYDQLTAEQLRQTLPAGAALVDFLFCTHYDFTQTQKSKRQQPRLTAFILRKDRRVVRLDLGAASAVEEAITSWRQTKGAKVRGEEDAGQTLRKLLWLPLEKHVADAKVVLLSPDGALARLPFAALPGSKEGTYLLEEVALAVVAVPQLLPELLAPAARGDSPRSSLLVVGDVDFDKSDIVVARADSRSPPRGALTGWGRLVGTLAEAETIRKTFDQRLDGTVTDLRGREATKAAVRAALPKHRFAHLATHGFFAPAELKSALAGRAGDRGMFGRSGLSGWHPLLLSGVVLAGANRAPKAGEEDGVLTALEVAEMELAGCELAVLSACETGLGESAGGEGVLGLQRAFQVSGARATLTSLWQVPDEGTRLLMQRFYANLWEKKMSRLDAPAQGAAVDADAGQQAHRGGARHGAARQERGAEARRPSAAVLLGRLRPLRRLAVSAAATPCLPETNGLEGFLATNGRHERSLGALPSGPFTSAGGALESRLVRSHHQGERGAMFSLLHRGVLPRLLT